MNVWTIVLMFGVTLTLFCISGLFALSRFVNDMFPDDEDEGENGTLL
jgi:uncharacterized protein YneF (UPF0154 family)